METPIILSPVLVKSTNGCKEFEYPLDGKIEDLEVSGAVRVVYEKSEKQSIRRKMEQGVECPVTLSYSDEQLNVSLETEQQQPFAGTIYIASTELYNLYLEKEAEVHVKGSFSIRRAEVLDCSKLDTSEVTFTAGCVHLIISSEEPFVAKDLHLVSFSLQASHAAKVEISSLSSEEVFVFLNDNASASLSGQSDTACFTISDSTCVDAANLHVTELDCCVRQHAKAVCYAANTRVFVSKHASYENKRLFALESALEDMIQMAEVRLLPKEVVSRIVSHLKVSAVDCIHWAHIIPEYNAERKTFSFKVDAHCNPYFDPDYIIFNFEGSPCGSLYKRSDAFSELFIDMLEKNMYDTDTVPDLLAVILEEDAVEWFEIQQDKELFLKSPVLDYEQELFES